MDAPIHHAVAIQINVKLKFQFKNRVSNIFI